MIKDFSMDALKEVVNIGTGQAATSLSEVLHQRVMINVPHADFVRIEDVPAILGGPQSPIVGVYFQTTGELQSKIMLIFSQDTGHTLASLLTGNTKKKEIVLDELEQSSIMEIGNIITNSYVNAMSQLLDIKLYPSIPYYAEDLLGAVIDFLLIEISQAAEYALILKTELMVESANLSGSFLIFPDEVFLKKLFDKLGVK